MISLIVAMDRNRVIGREGQLPWRMPADMRRFREITLGKAILMGRVTYESIGRPLDGRHNIVLTRDGDYLAQGCTVVNAVEAALAAAGEGEVVVIGGALLYEQMLPAADRIYLTLIDGEFQGDSYFPEIRAGAWSMISLEIKSADERNPYNYAFIVLERQATVD